jgi:hypothetical protein
MEDEGIGVGIIEGPKVKTRRRHLPSDRVQPRMIFSHGQTYAQSNTYIPKEYHIYIRSQL